MLGCRRQAVLSVDVDHLADDGQAHEGAHDLIISFEIVRRIVKELADALVRAKQRFSLPCPPRPACHQRILPAQHPPR